MKTKTYYNIQLHTPKPKSLNQWDDYQIAYTRWQMLDLVSILKQLGKKVRVTKISTRATVLKLK